MTLSVKTEKQIRLKTISRKVTPHPDPFQLSVALQQFCQSHPLDIWVNESLGTGATEMLSLIQQQQLFYRYTGQRTLQSFNHNIIIITVHWSYMAQLYVSLWESNLTALECRKTQFNMMLIKCMLFKHYVLKEIGNKCTQGQVMTQLLHPLSISCFLQSSPTQILSFG